MRRLTRVNRRVKVEVGPAGRSDSRTRPGCLRTTLKVVETFARRKSTGVSLEGGSQLLGVLLCLNGCESGVLGLDDR
jgi:hypothetical protein